MDQLQRAQSILEKIFEEQEKTIEFSKKLKEDVQTSARKQGVGFSLFKKKKEKNAKTLAQEVEDATIQHDIQKSILRVEYVSPIGAQNTNSIRILIRFNKSLGLVNELPYLPTITPKPIGGEWVAEDRELHFVNATYATSECYSITLPKAFSTVNGELLTDSREYKFTTTLNSVECVLPRNELSPNLVMAIVFAEPVTSEDVLRLISVKGSRQLPARF